MNYIILILALFYALSVRPLHAREPHNVISIDLFLPVMSPVSRLLGEDTTFYPLNVKYERVLSEHVVLMVKMGLAYSRDSEGESIMDVYPMLAFNYHPFDTGLNGFYFGPSLFFYYSSYSHSGTTADDDIDYSYWASVGGNIGYKFVLQSGIIVDMIFGLGYGYSKELGVNGGTVSSGYLVDETIGGVFVGYSF